MPRKVRLEPDEVERTNRIRVAQFFGKFPHEVDEMSYADFKEAIAVAEADRQNQQWDAIKRAQRARSARSTPRRRYGRRRR